MPVRRRIGREGLDPGGIGGGARLGIAGATDFFILNLSISRVPVPFPILGFQRDEKKYLSNKY
jgi:hypothetical protein